MWAKTISYSQMLSGHYSSYAWGDDPNTQLRKALGLRIGTAAYRGFSLRRVKWVLVTPTVRVSEKARARRAAALVCVRLT